MKMKAVKTFMYIICIRIILTVSCKHEVELTVDLVRSYERPTAVAAFLCWDKRVKMELAKLLMFSERPITIRYINEDIHMLYSTPKDAVIIADISCAGFEDLVKKANNRNMFGSPYRWIIFGSQTNGSVIPSTLENLNILHDSEVIVTQPKDAGFFELYLIYKIRTKQLWLAEYYGHWTKSSGLQISVQITSITKTLRRRNLSGERLAVTFNIDDMTMGSFSTQTDDRIRKSVYSITKWGFQQILPLYEFMNATRINIFANNWGYLVNGSWNGMVGNMARGEADIAGVPILISKERAEHINYLTNAVQTSVKFVFREPPLSYQNNLFLLPFNKAVWLSIAAFVLLMVVVIYFNAKWEATKLGNVGENYKNDIASDTKLTISDVLLMVVGAISQQGSFVELRGSIGRLVMFTLFFAFLFLFTAYSASIVALLQSSSKQIRTLSDLLNSRLELGVENTSYNFHYFTTVTDPVKKAIYETKVAPKGSSPNFMSIEDGVRKLQKHPFAFNMDIGKGYRIVEQYFFEHEKCGLQEISYFPTSKPWLTCRKASPYAELIKIGTFRIVEHGMNARVNRMVYSRRPVCSVSGGSFDSVSIIDVYPSLLMLLYGILLAITLLLAEVLFHRQRMTTRANPEQNVFDTADAF